MMTDARDAHPELTVVRLCEAFSLSRSSFYEYKNNEDTDPDDELATEIETIIEEFVGYGYRRITRELARRKKKVNHKRVLRVMRERGLTHRKKPRKTTTTDSGHAHQRYPNLLAVTHVLRPNQVWQADLSYVRVTGGFVYVACVLDSFTREIVGWSLSERLTADVALEALDNALIARCPSPGLIHHSDQGVQYACTAYTEALKAAGIVSSMSRTGNPYDNARMESFFKTLKAEEVNLQEYTDLDEAREGIGTFITLYNERRLHSSLGYVPPAEFAAQYHQAQI